MPASFYTNPLWTTATTTGVYVTVDVERGTLRGQEKISKFFPDKKYYSFEGIPYAKPPEGPLRFKVRPTYLGLFMTNGAFMPQAIWKVQVGSVFLDSTFKIHVIVP